jgi:tetratricopeptide (TPR) repeat protein
MKRVLVFLLLIALAAVATAQQAPPAQGQPAAPAAPAGKRPPQAKTQPEFDAFKAADSSPDSASLEKAAADFAQKFPDSELRVLLYKKAMRLYQNSNNVDKMGEMGQKVLGFDGDDPEALVNVAQSLTAHTRASDIDRDQKMAEAVKMAEKSIQTVDTDLVVPAGTPQANIDAYRAMLKSTAYSTIGTVYFNKDTKDDYHKAEEALQKSIDAYPAQPDPVTVLRLAIALDKQDKYTDALVQAEKAVKLTQDGTQVGSLARKELDRLKKLTENSLK